MTIENALKEGKMEFDTIIGMMELFLTLGDITNENRTLSDKVKYKERIVFSAMDKLMQGEFQIPFDWKELTDEQRNKRLDKTIQSVLPK
tara:strand:- start:2350 stop:2616 length:267 start_codon:yes stop_codon:yes gene_type:complete